MVRRYDIGQYAEALAFRSDGAARVGEILPEELIQQFWYDYAAESPTLTTVEGHALEVVSPGWWNRCAGPDFRGAQLRFNGKLYQGDVEIHLDQVQWQQHGHHEDPRYNDVLLHVVLNNVPEGALAHTRAGRPIPHLNLNALCAVSNGGLRPLLDVEEHPDLAPRRHGSCSRLLSEDDPERLLEFLHLSGDWRLLNKARQLEERIAAEGEDQAAYALVCRALGYHSFKEQFLRLGRALPIQRAIQLALQQPHLLETALLHLAGLLPQSDKEVEQLPPHGQRLAALRAEYLPGLRPLGLEWPLVGVRPNNYPCRRIAGLAGFIARVARTGLGNAFEQIWHDEQDPVALRKRFEALFPRPMGYWALHYRFHGKALSAPCALVGEGRVRSIIGNVIVPLALARARQRGDQSREELIFKIYHRLPKEPDNGVYKRMQPRVLGDRKMRMTFHLQQGLLQMHEDWCRSNPSCRNCALLAYLENRARTAAT